MDREEYGSSKPFKVWDSFRRIRKSLVACSLRELEQRAKDKMGIPNNEPVRLVLECDGTQVEDGEYFRTLPYNTVIMVLRNEQKWYPLNIEALRTALETIPRIVCETLHALDLHEESPSWKIMDNKGRITVVLHWDQRTPKVEKLLNALQTDNSKGKKPQSILKDKSTSFEISSESIASARKEPEAQLLHQPYVSFDSMRPPAAFFKEPQFSRFLKAGSFENANLHRHTIECASGSQNVVDIRPGSPHGNEECDFHCCMLHEEGRKIAVTRNVATSPIHQGSYSSPATVADGPKKSSKNVRFLDVEEHHPILHSEDENDNQSNSSETDTDTTTTLTEEEGVTEKFLLLVDEQKRHLSIKDIGVILERLSSKIIDVERLDRENENNDCRNWTIKAMIRGDGLEELGLIYAGRYYEISEHPGYKDATNGFAEEKGIIQNVEAKV